MSEQSYRCVPVESAPQTPAESHLDSSHENGFAQVLLRGMGIEGVAEEEAVAVSETSGVSSTPDWADGLYDGFYGAQEPVDVQNAAPVEAEPATGQLQVDLIARLLELGYDDSGAQVTRYGGYGGKGDPYSDGEGGHWVSKETGEPLRSQWVGPKDARTLQWYGVSGASYGPKPEKKRRAGPRPGQAHDGREYHCVGALSLALEAAGLYEKDLTALDGEQAVTRSKSGQRVTVDQGGHTGSHSLESLVNIHTYGVEGELYGSQRRAFSERATAEEQATIDADALVAEGVLEADSAAYRSYVVEHTYERLEQSDGLDQRLGGAATALALAGMGERVNPVRVKPGDVSQHWSGLGEGHATLVHVVHAEGVARVDDSGLACATGTWRDGAFRMDHTTDPEAVGTHVVQEIRKLGAHSVGGSDYNQRSESGEEKRATDGIHTGNASGIGTKKLEFYARPNNTPWVGWSPAFESLEDATASEVETTEKEDAGYSWGHWLGEGARGAADRVAELRDAGSDVLRALARGGSEEAHAEEVVEAVQADPKVSEVPPFVEVQGVYGCDYQVQADGSILYVQTGTTISPDSGMYGAVREQIETARAERELSPWPYPAASVEPMQPKARG